MNNERHSDLARVDTMPCLFFIFLGPARYGFRLLIAILSYSNVHCGDDTYHQILTRLVESTLSSPFPSTSIDTFGDWPGFCRPYYLYLLLIFLRRWCSFTMAARSTFHFGLHWYHQRLTRCRKSTSSCASSYPSSAVSIDITRHWPDFWSRH